MTELESIVVGIDIGSSKTAVVIAQKDAYNTEDLIVLGFGYVENLSSIKKGKLVDLQGIALSIEKACQEAILMSGIEFSVANVNIPGLIISSNSQGLVTVSNKDREIKIKDIYRVIEQAKTINIPNDRSLMHIIPQYFNIDEQDKIKVPLGMNGLRLEGFVHLIQGMQMNITNVLKCFEKVGLNAQDGVFNGIAASCALLNDNDKENGMVLLDIGAGITDYVVFQSGYPTASGSILMGGAHITRDIAVAFKISDNVAESIKRKYGWAIHSLVDPLEKCEISSHTYGERYFQQQELAKVIEARLEEIILLVMKDIHSKNINFEQVHNITVTGGTSLLKGICESIENILGIPCRLGTIQNLGGLQERVNNPIFASAIGLCLYREDFIFSRGELSNLKRKKTIKKSSNSSLGKIRSFIKDLLD